MSAEIGLRKLGATPEVEEQVLEGGTRIVHGAAGRQGQQAGPAEAPGAVLHHERRRGV
jgi:hypothetical protein